MPVYNAMPYLELAIKSIFAQTHKNWELIIVDDGSTDGSYEFVKSICDDRVFVYKNTQNMGNSFTCNRGIAYAKGDYIAKMDADDISLPKRLEKQMAFLVSNNDVDVIGCGLYKITKMDDIVSSIIPPQFHEDITKIVEFNKNIIFGPNILITDGALFGKVAWFRKWKYDDRIYFSQDFELMFKAKNKSKYANIQEVLYCYREGGVTMNIQSKMKSIFSKLTTILKHGDWSKESFLLFFSILSLGLRFISALTMALFPRSWYFKKVKSKSSIEDLDSIRKIKLIHANS